MKPVVILRPEPGASETVRRALALGLDARPRPLFTIEPIDWSPPDCEAFDALLFTSANAPIHAGPRLRALGDLPVLAVGEATARAARDRGLTVKTIGTGGVDSLLAGLRQPLRLLHLCGIDRHRPRKGEHAIHAIPVYRSREREAEGLAEDVAGAIVVVHSARAARRLAELVPLQARAQSAVAAISAAVARQAGEGWSRIESAPTPSDDAVLALAAALCQE